MKKILSVILAGCLIITLVASAMPASVNGSATLSQSEMQAVTGGGFWGCLGIGLGLIAVGLSGPIGWGATAFLAAGAIAGAIESCRS